MNLINPNRVRNYSAHSFCMKMKCDVSILSNDSACLFAVSKWSDINHIFWRITNSNHSKSDAVIRSVFASVPDMTAFMKHLKLYKYVWHQIHIYDCYPCTQYKHVGIIKMCETIDEYQYDSEITHEYQYDSIVTDFIAIGLCCSCFYKIKLELQVLTVYSSSINACLLYTSLPFHCI